MSEASPSTFSKIKSLVSNNKKQFIGGLILLIIIIGLIIYFVLSKKQNQIILVVSSNCAKCPEEIERFNTTWKDPNNPDAKTAKASIVDKDTKKGRKITKKYKIDAFPSIIAINKKGEYLIMDLSGSSDDNLLAKVADFINQDELVLYYAQWCGHSKTFLPIWKDFAKQANLNLNINTKMVDCDTKEGKELCAKYKVTGYPTVLLHKSANPDKPIVFNGDRTVDGLNAFVKANTK